MKKRVKKNQELAKRKGVTQMVNLSKSSLVLGIVLLFIAGLLIGYVISPLTKGDEQVDTPFKEKNSNQQQQEIVAEVNTLKTDLFKAGKYDCCLTNPCSECLLDEGECTCRQDVLAGKHPCAECIGEILEGEGQASLVPYFAAAIAHKVGTEHEAHLQSIIDTMYGDEEETSTTAQ